MAKERGTRRGGDPVKRLLQPPSHDHWLIFDRGFEGQNLDPPCAGFVTGSPTTRFELAPICYEQQSAVFTGNRD